MGLRRFLQKILLKPVLWASARFASRPDRRKVFPALNDLYEHILTEPGKRGLTIPFDYADGRFIIFSDQHKGGGDGSDDFAMAKDNYLAALEYYYQNDFIYINLGDSEELWESKLGQVKKTYPDTFEAEAKFVQQSRFIKIFGNHDLYWDNDPIAWWQLKKIYQEDVKIYEGVILSTTIRNRPFHIFCTHGHQGDASSDGNWFSKFFVAKIWAPLQAFLRMNPNTPAYDAEKKTLHNEIMYEWSSKQKDLLLITGHTHQPVFGSLTHLERLYKRFQEAASKKDDDELAAIREEIRQREKEFSAVSVDYMSMKPTYFNSGCCCFSDGDITGIEVDNGHIRLVKWTKDDQPTRQVLETASLVELAANL